MVREKRPHTHRYEVIRRIVIAIAVIMALLWTAFRLLQPAPQRRIVWPPATKAASITSMRRRYIEILQARWRAGRGADDGRRRRKPEAPARSRLACRCCVHAGRCRRIAVGPRRGHAGEPVLRAALDFLSGLGRRSLRSISSTASASRSVHREAARELWSSGVLLANGLVAADGIARGNTKLVSLGGADAMQAR